MEEPHTSLALEPHFTLATETDPPVSHAQTGWLIPTKNRAVKGMAARSRPSAKILPEAVLCVMKENKQSRLGHVSDEAGAQRNAEVTRRYLEAVSLANLQRNLVFQEVLSKPCAEAPSLAEQEFFELCIEESDDVWRPGFIVKQTHAQWSEIDRQVMWEEPEWERWPTLTKAKERCEEWRQNLAARGFTQSDMDF